MSDVMVLAGRFPLSRQGRVWSRLHPGLVDGHHLPVSHHVSSLFKHLLEKETCWIRDKPHSTVPSFQLLHLQQPYFQIRSHSEVLGVRTSTCGFWGHNSAHNTLRFRKTRQGISPLR